MPLSTSPYMRLLFSTVCIRISIASFVPQQPDFSTCETTRVAILGAGISGIGVGHELSAHNISDFVILEHNDYIGGRIVHAPFGHAGDPSTPQYVVELGANWVHGRKLGDIPNPVWEMVQQYQILTQPDYNSTVLTFDETGKVDYFDEIKQQFDQAKQKAGELAGFIAREELVDISVRAGLRYAGWHTELDPHKRAYEWYDFPYSTAVFPEDASLLDQYGQDKQSDSDESSDGNEYDRESHRAREIEDGGEDSDDQIVIDPRGYNTIVRGKANDFLKPQDSRLRLKTAIISISYSDNGTTIHTGDGQCIHADYAVCTFSVGVLHQGNLTFSPPLPELKRLAIANVNMGTYTKIFLQFNESFWGNDTAFLYADKTRSGYYPVWQVLVSPIAFPRAHIIFATVVGQESARIERQTDEETMTEMMDVLRVMFPHVAVPNPTAILYPRWGTLPWAYGSYSSFGPGFTPNLSDALAANVGRLWFAGEALASYQATTHGAWLNGLDVGKEIAGKLGH